MSCSRQGGLADSSIQCLDGTGLHAGLVLFRIIHARGTCNSRLSSDLDWICGLSTAPYRVARSGYRWGARASSAASDADIPGTMACPNQDLAIHCGPPSTLSPPCLALSGEGTSDKVGLLDL